MAENGEKTLKDCGTILLCGDINTENIKKAALDLLEVDSKLNTKYDHIKLIINSNGGDCRDGFMLIDILELCRHPIHTTGLGICASMGFMILCSGAKGFRKITENTSLLCHQFSWCGGGKRHELVSRRKEEDFLHDRFIRHLVKHTNLKEEKVVKHLMPATDVWLTPDQAIEYGIVDEIINNK